MSREEGSGASEGNKNDAKFFAMSNEFLSHYVILNIFYSSLVIWNEHKMIFHQKSATSHTKSAISQDKMISDESYQDSEFIQYIIKRSRFDINSKDVYLLFLILISKFRGFKIIFGIFSTKFKHHSSTQQSIVRSKMSNYLLSKKELISMLKIFIFWKQFLHQSFYVSK